MPLPAYNFGVKLQWQLDDQFYAMMVILLEGVCSVAETKLSHSCSRKPSAISTRITRHRQRRMFSG